MKLLSLFKFHFGRSGLVDLLCPIREEIVFQWMDHFSSASEPVQKLKDDWEAECKEDVEEELREKIEELQSRLNPVVQALDPRQQDSELRDRFEEEFVQALAPPSDEEKDDSSLQFGCINSDFVDSEIPWQKIQINNLPVECEMMRAFHQFVESPRRATDGFAFENVRDLASLVFENLNLESFDDEMTSLTDVWNRVLRDFARSQSGKIDSVMDCTLDIQVVQWLNDRLYRFRKFFGTCVFTCFFEGETLTLSTS